MKTLEVVCGILKNKDGYLIAKRGNGVHENIWEFPGGKVECNETREDAIVRELKEELNLNCEVMEYLTSVNDQREDVLIHVHAYLCEEVSGTLNLQVHSNAKRVSINDLYTYEFEPSDIAILNALKQHELENKK